MLTTILPLSSPHVEEGLSSQAQTVDFGIQVDLTHNPEKIQNCLDCDEEIDSLDENLMLSQLQRRKQKKKLYKRKKKQKAQQMQRQARRQINSIIQEFYELTARFDDYQDEIELLVQLIYNYNFREYLDQLIRVRVDYIQKSLWEYTQSIFYSESGQRSEQKLFCCCMIDELYDRFSQIESASAQIEKIINVYLKFAYSKEQSKDEIVYSNLAVNTFNYMIETDDTLKVTYIFIKELVQSCDKNIGEKESEHRKKLDYMISMLESFYLEDSEHEEEKHAINWHDELQSTGHSDEGELSEVRKKKKKKIKESDLSMNEESIIRRLNELVIRECERTECRVSEQWINLISLKAVRYRNLQHDRI